MMILKEFSRIVCVSLFSYQGSLFVCLSDSSFTLSHSSVPVKYFFQVFSKLFKWIFVIRCSSATRLLYHIHFRMSTSFLSFLFSFLFFKKEKSASFRSGLKYIIECILRQVVFYHFPKNCKKTFTSTSYLYTTRRKLSFSTNAKPVFPVSVLQSTVKIRSAIHRNTIPFATPTSAPVSLLAPLINGSSAIAFNTHPINLIRRFARIYETR